MKTHIQRRHNAGIGQQQPTYGLLDSSTPQTLFGQREQREKDSFSKTIDDIRDTYETMRRIAEIRNMSTQFQSSSCSFSLDQLPHIMRTFTMPDVNAKFNMTKGYTASLDALDNMSVNNKDIGFRGHICNKCFHCWVDLVYSNSKDMIALAKSTKPSMHRCNPEKVAEAQINVQDIESKKNTSENTLFHMLLTSIFLLWCLVPQNKIWLKTEELTISPAYSSSESDAVHREDKDYSSQLHRDDTEEQKQQQHVPMSFGIQREQINCNSVDIDLGKVEKSHWAYRAIAEAQNNGKSSISMDGAELIDFVKLIKGNYGILTEHIDGSTLHFFMYLSFKDN